MAGAVSGANCPSGVSNILWSYNRKPEGHATKQPAWLSPCDYTSYVKKQDVLIVSFDAEDGVRPRKGDCSAH